MLDGGIIDGGDVVAAVAIGARACLVARAYLYGLMAGGEAGVQRAGDLLAAGITRTMALMGATSRLRPHARTRAHPQLERLKSERPRPTTGA